MVRAILTKPCRNTHVGRVATVCALWIVKLDLKDTVGEVIERGRPRPGGDRIARNDRSIRILHSTAVNVRNRRRVAMTGRGHVERDRVRDAVAVHLDVELQANVDRIRRGQDPMIVPGCELRKRRQWRNPLVFRDVKSAWVKYDKHEQRRDETQARRCEY